MPCTSDYSKMSRKMIRWNFSRTKRQTHRPFLVYLDRYGPLSSLYSLLPFAASCPEDCTISVCPTLHVRSISSSTCIPPASSINNISASSTRACALAPCADWRFRCVRSFLFAICLYPSSGNSRVSCRDLGTLVCLATELEVWSDFLGFEGPLFAGICEVFRFLYGFMASALAIRESIAVV